MSELGSLYSNITGSALIKTGAGTVSGFIVNSHTGGTLKLRDAVTPTTPLIINTFSFPSGSGVYMFPEAINFATGLYASVGGVADITIIYN